jgi:hypothetical protein
LWVGKEAVSLLRRLFVGAGLYDWLVNMDLTNEIKYQKSKSKSTK